MSRVRRVLSLATGVAGLLAAAARAQVGPPGLLRDVATAPNVEQPYLILQGGIQFVAIGGAIYFDAWDGSSGLEVWRSDGTAAGTALLRDICPGSCGSRVEPEL